MSIDDRLLQPYFEISRALAERKLPKNGPDAIVSGEMAGMGSGWMFQGPLLRAMAEIMDEL